MKKLIFALFMSLVPMLLPAQTDSTFNVTLHNDEYKIYITMNLYDKDVDVPGQAVLGKVDGFIASKQSSSKWIIVSSRIISKTEAEIEVINDYGSEDFMAVIKRNADGTYSYTKKGGSTLKFAVRGKWQKIPGSLELVK
ncbi:hypothetical protein [uncultured Prevotella sp.]|uniref:hypothetical protein n=1 Tax=uncultured Prevotella sp. TaxID=159272 RepID=UPI0026291999|nr:hypothetical protein [uncultured Prevotella sp.]